MTTKGWPPSSFSVVFMSLWVIPSTKEYYKTWYRPQVSNETSQYQKFHHENSQQISMNEERRKMAFSNIKPKKILGFSLLSATLTWLCLSFKFILKSGIFYTFSSLTFRKHTVVMKPISIIWKKKCTLALIMVNLFFCLIISIFSFWNYEYIRHVLERSHCFHSSDYRLQPLVSAFPN